MCDFCMATHMDGCSALTVEITLMMLGGSGAEGRFECFDEGADCIAYPCISGGVGILKECPDAGLPPSPEAPRPAIWGVTKC